ncbi:MAG: SEC-C metal-binding domain-containing protein [bacterium]
MKGLTMRFLSFFFHRWERSDSSKPVEETPRSTIHNPNELISLYKHYRAKGMELNSVLVRELPKDILLSAGRALGIARGKTLVFESKDETSVLMDYCIYDCPWGGKYACEWYLEKHQPAPNSMEYHLLTAMRDARYGIYRVVEIKKGVGALLEDMFRRENIFVMDYGISVSAIEGLTFAGRLIAPDNRFLMTTGAMLPLLDEEAIISIFEFIANNIAATPEQLAHLSREQLKEISTFVIRTLLCAGVANNITYQTTPGVPSTHIPPLVTTPPPAGPYPGTARNAPCPCGSGKKYKKCCLGKD